MLLNCSIVLFLIRKEKVSGVIYNATNIEIFIHIGVVNYKYNQDYCKAFGQHLRKLREKQGVSMRQFALLADMEYSQLSKIERGTTNPTISTVLALAVALEVPPTILFDFKFTLEDAK